MSFSGLFHSTHLLHKVCYGWGVNRGLCASVQCLVSLLPLPRVLIGSTRCEHPTLLDAYNWCYGYITFICSYIFVIHGHKYYSYIWPIQIDIFEIYVESE